MRKLAHKLSQLEPEDPTRRKLESAMLEKLHSMGIIEKSREQGGALSQVEHLTVSAICRRRLPIVMVREQKMIQYVDKVSASSYNIRFWVNGDMGISANLITRPLKLSPKVMSASERRLSKIPLLWLHGTWSTLCNGFPTASSNWLARITMASGMTLTACNCKGLEGRQWIICSLKAFGMFCPDIPGALYILFNFTGCVCSSAILHFFHFRVKPPIQTKPLPSIATSNPKVPTAIEQR